MIFALPLETATKHASDTCLPSSVQFTELVKQLCTRGLHLGDASWGL